MDASMDLPVEVTDLILSKSPIKSVVRFKSVSKSWLATIFDPRFTRIHRILRSKLSENQNTFLTWARSKKPGEGVGRSRMVVIRLKDGKFQTESELRHPSRKFLLPMCSCDGIHLFISDPDCYNKFLLWNPSIKKKVVIRSPRMPDKHAFTMYHIFHDSTTDDYTIAMASAKYYTLYSCRNRSWSEMKELPCDQRVIYHGVSLDGCFYGSCNGEIVCFDARDGKLSKFGQPGDVRGGKVKLGLLSGRRVCLYTLTGDNTRLKLWVMEKNGSFENCWRKLMSMEKEEGGLRRLHPICLSNDDNIVITAELQDEDVHLIYNHRQNSFELFEFNWEIVLHSPLSPYVENLKMPSSNILD